MKYANETSITQLATDVLTKVKEVTDNKQDKLFDSRRYQNIIASAANQEGGTFYMFKVKPNNWYEPCTVRWRVHGYINKDMTNANKLLYDEQSISEMIFTGTGLVYRNTNSIYNASYRPYYYLSVYRLTQAGFNAGFPHYVGVSLYNATNQTTATLKRDFEVEVLEVIDGSVEMLDEPVKAATFYSSTNYSGISNTDATSGGTKQTGDNNTIDRTCFASLQPKAVDVQLFGTQLILSADGEGFYSITNKRSTSLTDTGKKVNQYPFKPEHILYDSNAGTINVGSRISTSAIYRTIPFDFRYSYKGSALTAHKAIYLVATYDADTDTYTPVANGWITQTVPTTEDGLYYVQLGYAYSTTSIYLDILHPVRKYVNGGFRLKEQADLYEMLGGLENGSY